MHLLVPYSPSWGFRALPSCRCDLVYAAAMASIKRESRRFLLSFLSIASLVLAGLEVVTTIGLTGALCVWFSVGISLGGLLDTTRVEARIGRVRLIVPWAVRAYAHLAGLFMLTGLASIP